jgi:phosphate/sulfate permease
MDAALLGLLVIVLVGVGSTRRLSAVRWGVAGNVVVAWLVTLPAAAAVAGVAFFLTHLVVG